MSTSTNELRKGERTRAAILDEAARLATVEGLEHLSIGALANAIGMSKSGLYAHFGSKRELQLATIGAARATFIDQVLRPALAAPTGVRRLAAACEAFLSHVQRRVFPGGCFFAAAAAEVGTRPGPVRDVIAAQQRDWLALLQQLAVDARAAGELDPDTDPPQLAFELNALLVAANTAFILHDDPSSLDRARAAIHTRLHLPGPSSPPARRGDGQVDRAARPATGVRDHAVGGAGQ